jgi:hypothetical protein
VLDGKSKDFISRHFEIGEILNLEVVRYAITSFNSPYSVNLDKNSIELKVPKYYLDTDNETIQEYCKLAKYSHEDKYKQAVAAIVRSGRKKERKYSLSLKSKAFLPKGKTAASPLETGLMNICRKLSHENPTIDSPL